MLIEIQHIINGYMRRLSTFLPNSAGYNHPYPLTRVRKTVPDIFTRIQ